MKKLILILSIFLLSGCSIYEEINIYHDYKPVKKIDLNPIEAEFVVILNQHRENLGLGELTPEVLASKVCLEKNLNDIELGIEPNHIGWSLMVSKAMVSDEDGDQIFAYNYTNATDLFNAYMASPPHKEALENPYPNRTHIGISFIQRRNYILILKYQQQ